LRKYILYFSIFSSTIRGVTESGLQSNIFQTPILSTQRSAQDGFNKEDLARITLTIPPLNEQHRIVAKLEKLLTKVDACKERL